MFSSPFKTIRDSKLGRTLCNVDIENLTAELSYNHTPTSYLFDVQARTKKISLHLPTRNINWIKYKKNLKEATIINPNTSTKELIHIVIQQFTTTIAQAHEDNATTFTPTDRKQYLLKYIQAEITLKRKILSNWKRTRDQAYKIAFNRQASSVKDLLQVYNEENSINLFREMEPCTKCWTKLHKFNTIFQ